MRTQDEIVARIDEIKEWDIFGFQIGDLIYCLDYEHAKKYLKEGDEGPTENEWSEHVIEPTEENIKKTMKEYMEFAWDKANNCRGMSASRSMSHYMAWIWLLGDEEVEYFGDLESYQYYGKDNLVKICERYGWDHTQWDDGIRSNSEY